MNQMENRFRQQFCRLPNEFSFLRSRLAYFTCYITNYVWLYTTMKSKGGKTLT